jgi:hypothetical protein
MKKHIARKTRKTKLAFCAGIAFLTVGFPLQVLAASNSVECAPLSSNSSAATWYSTGRDLANEGFLNLAYFSMERATRDPSANVPTSLAALECLAKIEAKNPIVDLPMNASLLTSLSAKTKAGSSERRALEAYAFRSLLQSIANGAKGNSFAVYRQIFSQPGSLRSSALALMAVAGSPAGDAKTTNLLRAAISEIENGTAGEEAKALRATFRLSLARNLYASGANPAAAAEYEKLFKIGAPMQDALIESAWSQLRAKNYVKSIGFAFELTTGKLSEFFAPEALSIRAISFVENCRFSEAKQAIAKFDAEYRPLAAWLRTAGSSSSLYETAIARSEEAIGADSIPEKAWSMWSGSDVFTSAQNAIQKSFGEEREAAEWIADRTASAAVKSALNFDLKKIGAIRERATSRIENRLARLNGEMLSRIAKESERLRFVGIEANQGAGRDLVYRNANPELNEVEKDFAKAERKAKSYKGKLAWGKAKKDDPAAEMWVDEIGAYEAHTLNRCQAKAKYKEMRAAI